MAAILAGLKEALIAFEDAGTSSTIAHPHNLLHILMGDAVGNWLSFPSLMAAIDCSTAICRRGSDSPFRVGNGSSRFPQAATPTWLNIVGIDVRLWIIEGGGFRVASVACLSWNTQARVEN